VNRNFFLLIFDVFMREGWKGLVWRRNVLRTLRGKNPHVHDNGRQALVNRQYQSRRSFFCASSLEALDSEGDVKPLTFSFVLDARDWTQQKLQKSLNELRCIDYQNIEIHVIVPMGASVDLKGLNRTEVGTHRKVKIHLMESASKWSSVLSAVLDASDADFVHLQRVNARWCGSCLNTIALHVAKMPEAEVIYCDHEEFDEKVDQYFPVFKSDFNPVLLLNHNYIGDSVWFSKSAFGSVVDQLGDHAPLSVWDAIWQVLDSKQNPLVVHVPYVLYTQACLLQIASSHECLQREERERVIKAHCARTALRWSLMEAREPVGGAWGRPTIPSPLPLVSIIIPTRDRVDLLKTSVQSVLELTDYSAVELIIVDNGSVEPSTHAYFANCLADQRVKIVRDKAEFNFSRLNNLGVAHARGDFVLLLNNDVEVMDSQWLGEMVSWASVPRAGCIGAKLWYPDGRLQHGGVVVGICGVAGHAHRGITRSDVGYLDRAVRVQNVSAVTGACLLVSRCIYEELGGLDERFAVTCNDIDFCLRVMEAGYLNVWTPFAQLIHHESASRGLDDVGAGRERLRSEVDLFRARWPQYIDNDPFYNPNLTRVDENFSLKSWWC